MCQFIWISQYIGEWLYYSMQIVGKILAWWWDNILFWINQSFFSAYHLIIYFLTGQQKMKVEAQWMDLLERTAILKPQLLVSFVMHIHTTSALPDKFMFMWWALSEQVNFWMLIGLFSFWNFDITFKCNINEMSPR